VIRKGIRRYPFKHAYSLSLGFAVYKNKEVSVFESLSLETEEKILGFGEKYYRLDRREKTMISWNTDTIFFTTDRAYKNVLFFISNRGYGVFINTPEKIRYEVRSQSFVSNSFEIFSDILDYFFIYGPSIRDIIYRYCQLTGFPAVPPFWSFGLWISRFGYKTREEVETVADDLKNYDIPCSVIHLDPFWMREEHYCDFEWNTKKFPDAGEVMKNLKEKGIRISLWKQPYIPQRTALFNEGKEKGYFVRKKNGDVYLIKDAINKLRRCGIVDFTNPDVVRWYQDIHRKLLRQGVSVFKLDMGEAIPEDGVFHNGKTGRAMHNFYILLYQKAVFEVYQEFSKKDAIIWGRSVYAVCQRYPVHWSGDPLCNYRDMAFNLRGGLSWGLSGGAFWSHDIGGFDGKPTPEFYIRWAQFGLLSSHSRCHGTTPREPWEYGKKVLEIFRKYVKLRYRLIPYIYTYAHAAAETGLPVIRALPIEYQDDPNCYYYDLEYLLGRELLIAPVFSDEEKRELHLPEGEWIDYWNKISLRGKQLITYKAPLDIIPMFIRMDSIIPYYTEIIDFTETEPVSLTVEFYVRNKGIFRLRDDYGSIVYKAGWEE